MLSYQPEKEEGVAPEIIVQGHFLSSEININFRYDNVFQSGFSSLENDVVVQFLNNIDRDEDSENASMGTLDCEIGRDIGLPLLQEDYE